MPSILWVCLDSTAVGGGREALDGCKLIEDFIDIAMMHNSEAAEVSHTMSKVARKFDDTGKLWQGAGFGSVGVSKIGGDKLVRLIYDIAANGFARKRIREMFKTVVNEMS